MNQIQTIGGFSDQFGTLFIEHYLRIVVFIPPFGIHIGNGEEPVEIIVAFILGLTVY